MILVKKRGRRRKTRGAICEPSIIRRRRTFKKLKTRRKKPSEEFVGCLPLIFGKSVLSANAAEVEVSGDLFWMTLISFAIERFRSLRGIDRLQRRLTVVPRQCFRLCHGGLGIFSDFSRFYDELHRPPSLKLIDFRPIRQPDFFRQRRVVTEKDGVKTSSCQVQKEFQMGVF